MVNFRKNLSINIALKERKNIKPNYILEQYELDSDTSTRFISNILSYIKKGTVLDAGCGSGALTIAAILLGVNHLIAIDIDPNSLKIIKENLKTFEIHQNVDIILADFLNFNLKRKIEAIIMNPPFGTKIRKIDRKFVLKAFQLSDIVCPLLKEGNERFFNRLAHKNGFKMIFVDRFRIVIRNIMKFHRKKKYVIYASQLLFIKN